MDVTDPANTTPIVYVPTSEIASITESGKPVSTAEGVKSLRMEKESAVFAVWSGNYRFQSPLKEAIQ